MLHLSHSISKRENWQEKEDRENYLWIFIALFLLIAIPAGFFRWFDVHSQMEKMHEEQALASEVFAHFLEDKGTQIDDIVNTPLSIPSSLTKNVSVLLFYKGAMWTLKTGGDHLEFHSLTPEERSQTPPEGGIRTTASVFSDGQIIFDLSNDYVQSRKNRSAKIITSYFVLQALLLPLPARRLTSLITKRRRHKEEIRKQAFIDPLTGLYNRALFLKNLDKEVLRAKRNCTQFAVLFVDLDDFKPVNDTYGHAIGDQLLQQVAARLAKTVRKADIVSRFGGDEFCLLLENISEKGADIVADKLHDDFRQPFVVSTFHIRIQASIGLAVYPDDATSGPDLLRLADQDMYQNKQEKKQKVA